MEGVPEDLLEAIFFSFEKTSFKVSAQNFLHRCTWYHWHFPVLKARLRRSHGMLQLCASSWGLAKSTKQAFVWGLSPVKEWSYAIGQCYIRFFLYYSCFLFHIESFISSSCMTELRKCNKLTSVSHASVLLLFSRGSTRRCFYPFIKLN